MCLAISATTELGSDRNNEDKSDNASELPSFAAIVEDAVDEGFPLAFFIPGRSLAAALSAITPTLPKCGSMVCHIMALAAATLQCAREKNITFTR